MTRRRAVRIAKMKARSKGKKKKKMLRRLK